MDTYFLQFKVIPTDDNEQFYVIEGALASCWVLEKDPETAARKAAFQVSKYDWEIVSIENPSVKVDEEDFAERDIGLEQFRKAQAEGMAIIYLGWARDKKTSFGPVSLNSSYKPDLQGFLNELKKLRNKGRCLHYDAGHRCKEFINAHSIQKSGLLSIIAQGGHVYSLAAEIGRSRDNLGRPTYKKIGISKVSTFLGFCKQHDNDLFKPIDDDVLLPTDQQVLLYAYRSLARELFVKENVLTHMKGLVEKVEHKYIKNVFNDYRSAIQFGFKNLQRHKSAYDKSLESHFYQDVRYVVFVSDQKPTIAFSGLLYPDFDFMGRRLQNLEIHDEELRLITFCSAPMTGGWGYVFAWHHTSSDVCTEFMRSLATMMHQRHDLSDFLFRMVIYNCENCAISPEWWESLSEKQREEISAGGAVSAHPFSPIKSGYLTEGLVGVSGWRFPSVISNME